MLPGPGWGLPSGSQPAIRKDELWGEYADSESDPGGKGMIRLTASEKEALTRLPRPLPLEGPRIHQPSGSAAAESTPNVMVVLPVEETSPRDPYVLHSLHLLTYLQKLKQYSQSRLFGANRDLVGAFLRLHRN